MKQIQQFAANNLEVVLINTKIAEMNKPFLLKQTREALNVVHSGIQVKASLF